MSGISTEQFVDVIITTSYKWYSTFKNRQVNTPIYKTSKLMGK